MGDNDKLDHKKDEVVGQAKETLGKVTDDEELEAEGRGEKAKSKVQQAGDKVGDAADKAGDAVKDALGRDDKR